jgi:tetratricopeptide (TPR) repeat protein
MHENIACRLTGLAGILLALACRTAPARGAIFSDQEPATTLVMAVDDSPTDAPAPQAPAALVVQSGHGGAAAPADGETATLTIADDAAPLESAAPQGAESKLFVVANQARQAPLASVTTDGAVMPASSVEAVDDHRFYAEGPFSCNGEPMDVVSAGGAAPSHYAGTAPSVRQRLARLNGSASSVASPKAQGSHQRVAARSQPPQKTTASPKVRTAERRDPGAQRTSSSKRTPNVQTPADLLLRAHALSQSAASEADYSQIVDLCSAASRQGLENESKQYAATLTSWALNRRGQERADRGQKDLALADFQAALQADGSCWRALHNRGVTYAQAGQFAEAFDDICRVIELNPKFAKAYSNRATLYVQAADLEKAMADYDAAIKLDPKLTPALVGRGRVRHMHGQLDTALKDLTAAAKLAPKDAEIICSRADLLADLGRYGEAVEDYARAIDLNPHFEHAFRNGAWLLATCPDESVRDVDGALAGAKAALNCGYGERHAALDTLAAALANAGRFDEAVGTLHQAVDIAPEELRTVYEARLKLYESHQPYRTRPIGEAQVATAAFDDR